MESICADCLTNDGKDWYCDKCECYLCEECHDRDSCDDYVKTSGLCEKCSLKKYIDELEARFY